jgi:hypothetical protein
MPAVLEVLSIPISNKSIDSAFTDFESPGYLRYSQKLVFHVSYYNTSNTSCQLLSHHALITVAKKGPIIPIHVKTHKSYYTYKTYKVYIKLLISSSRMASQYSYVEFPYKVCPLLGTVKVTHMD